MGLDEELENIEDLGETDAEWTDQETELEDFESDEDEIFDADAAESDLEHAYDSFSTNNETDYDGWDEEEVEDAVQAEEDADILHSEGYHVEEVDDIESEVIEMEIEDGDIYAMIVDEDDNEIGFILLDEDGNEQEYYYVDEDDDDEGVRVERASDGDEFDLGISREGVAAATADVNAIYRDGIQVAAELKDTFSEITDSLNFLKKK
ncbi:hypothetical protein [Adlercreutzia equolifaciens]|uniref:hypothetical protein n=1 Tax=Adlercreutzia equolifaciens TaxID=446660 RepID=UPI0023B07661|nr:hypothetical protein [Adlercreutzia equolifaciens]MCI9262841.1 hypothetical protein [Eggerthellaceae bacterium]MDE8703419.1 hypothetical protein [Adlercreutzia equolifaciens]MEE0706347.1 hypothetical protein [Adlercreutzia sp.]